MCFSIFLFSGIIFLFRQQFQCRDNHFCMNELRVYPDNLTPFILVPNSTLSEAGINFADRLVRT